MKFLSIFLIFSFAFIFSEMTSVGAQCPGLEASDIPSYQKGAEFIATVKIIKVRQTGRLPSTRPKEHPQGVEMSVQLLKAFKGKDLVPEEEAASFVVKTAINGKEGKKAFKKWTKNTELLVFAQTNEEKGLNADYCDLMSGERVDRLVRALEKLN